MFVLMLIPKLNPIIDLTVINFFTDGDGITKYTYMHHSKCYLNTTKCNPDRLANEQHNKDSRVKKNSYLQRRIPRCRFYTCNRTSHDQPMATNPTIPFWANPFQLDILKSSFLEPLNVLFLLREEHPHICKEARQPKRRINRTN